MLLCFAFVFPIYVPKPLTLPRMPSTAPSHHELVQSHQEKLLASIDSGTAKPFFLSSIFLLFGLPLLGLLVGSRYIRLAILALVYSVALDIFRYRRCLLGASGYMIGVITSYWVIWSTTLLLFNDPKNFRRIERQAASTRTSSPEFIDLHKNGDMIATDPDYGTASLVKSSAQRSEGSSKGPTSERYLDRNETLVWQPYPQPFLHRLNWVFDLLVNMRGPQWNWRISSMGPLPASVHERLNPGKRDTSLDSDNPETMDARARLKAAFWTFLKSYLLLDLLKVVMMRDPYFKGMVSPAPPPPFPFSYLQDNPILVTLYRQFVTGFGVFICLKYAFVFNPIIFLGLSVALPNFSRAITSVPLDAPWLYSDDFGPFLITAAEGGLAGCWGKWWHQYFRAGFTNTSLWVLSFFPEKLATKRIIRQTVSVFVAFTLSGLIHMGGSYVQIADTNPRGPFTFFLLQAIGVTIEDLFKRAILSGMLPYTLPRWVKWTANCLFVACWLVFTGSYIADDFARGGIWLTEPVPVSILRWLNIGIKGDGWWCWKEPWFRFWKGEGWWDSGLMVL